MAQIEHVVVLMLENRSFDSMLGRLYEGRDDFNGVPKDAVNVWQDKPYPVWTSPVSLSTDLARIPTPDPNEDFADMTHQLFGAGKKSSAPATMSGFAANYAKTTTHRPGDVMHGFTPEQLPVLSTLAKSFAVCDEWHEYYAASRPPISREAGHRLRGKPATHFRRSRPPITRQAGHC